MGSRRRSSFTGSSQSHAASRKEFDDRVSGHYGFGYCDVLMDESEDAHLLFVVLLSAQPLATDIASATPSHSVMRVFRAKRAVYVASFHFPSSPRTEQSAS